MQKLTMQIGRPQDLDTSDLGCNLVAECGFDINAVLEVVETALDCVLYNPQDEGVVPASYDDIKAAYDLVSKASKTNQYA